ncbi:hypothetical protein M9H77_33949 [Catharanthus roseus]|uniref:Uncharacterized protein n=1 Tax=Catharanthus roseus TaxID=4058 RepID=A0ACB9ZJW2_CATRO|nr:hypothetical protein M9H77_33949 [Catharanthus roseus]
MGSRAIFMMMRSSTISAGIFFNLKRSSFPIVKNVEQHSKKQSIRNYSQEKSSLESPADVARLAETARISLTPDEVEEFAPKIRQVVDWFGQLQAVDLQSIEPSIRADTEGDNIRDDLPATFENRESIISSIPSYEEPYIKVPKVLNKE